VEDNGARDLSSMLRGFCIYSFSLREKVGMRARAK
jgi:hypothetical protein